MAVIKRKAGDSVQFDTVIVGRVVKRLRTEKGMTQEVLSGFAGVARDLPPKADRR